MDNYGNIKTLGAIQGNAISAPPTFPVLQSAINEIGSIAGHAHDIYVRQINLCDRIFGCSPELTSGGIKGSPEKPQGALPEMQELLAKLRGTLDSIDSKLCQLERMA
jgi:hypothetical protein